MRWVSPNLRTPVAALSNGLNVPARISSLGPINAKVKLHALGAIAKVEVDFTFAKIVVAYYRKCKSGCDQA